MQEQERPGARPVVAEEQQAVVAKTDEEARRERLTEIDRILDEVDEVLEEPTIAEALSRAEYAKMLKSWAAGQKRLGYDPCEDEELIKVPVPASSLPAWMLPYLLDEIPCGSC